MQRPAEATYQQLQQVDQQLALEQRQREQQQDQQHDAALGPHRVGQSHPQQLGELAGAQAAWEQQTLAAQRAAEQWQPLKFSAMEAPHGIVLEQGADDEHVHGHPDRAAPV